MSENVVSIHGVSVNEIIGAPEPEIVEMLERALDEARNGKIVAIGIVKVFGNNNVQTPWHCPGMSGHLLVAGAAYLSHELIANSLCVDGSKLGDSA